MSAVSLSEIRTQAESATIALEDALELVCDLALKQPEGVQAVAALHGFRRELEALKKVELSLISHGKPTA